MTESTPPVWEAPDPGASPHESEGDVAASPSTAPSASAASASAAGDAPADAAAPAPATTGGRARSTLRRASAATVTVALVGVLVGGGLGYAIGRATTSGGDDASRDAASGTLIPGTGHDRWQGDGGPGLGGGHDGLGSDGGSRGPSH